MGQLTNPDQIDEPMDEAQVRRAFAVTRTTNLARTADCAVRTVFRAGTGAAGAATSDSIDSRAYTSSNTAAAKPRPGA